MDAITSYKDYNYIKIISKKDRNNILSLEKLEENKIEYFTDEIGIVIYFYTIVKNKNINIKDLILSCFDLSDIVVLSKNPRLDTVYRIKTMKEFEEMFSNHIYKITPNNIFVNSSLFEIDVNNLYLLNYLGVFDKDLVSVSNFSTGNNRFDRRLRQFEYYSNKYLYRFIIPENKKMTTKLKLYYYGIYDSNPMLKEYIEHWLDIYYSNMTTKNSII